MKEVDQVTINRINAAVGELSNLLNMLNSTAAELRDAQKETEHVLRVISNARNSLNCIQDGAFEQLSRLTDILNEKVLGVDEEET